MREKYEIFKIEIYVAFSIQLAYFAIDFAINQACAFNYIYFAAFLFIFICGEILAWSKFRN
jgi:hypothetical protein